MSRKTTFDIPDRKLTWHDNSSIKKKWWFSLNMLVHWRVNIQENILWYHIYTTKKTACKHANYAKLSGKNTKKCSQNKSAALLKKKASHFFSQKPNLPAKNAPLRSDLGELVRPSHESGMAPENGWVGIRWSFLFRTSNGLFGGRTWLIFLVLGKGDSSFFMVEFWDFGPQTAYLGGRTCFFLF